MLVDVFEEEYTITFSPVRGLYALKDRFGHKLLLADSLASCEAAIAQECGIDGDFTMLYSDVRDNRAESALADDDDMLIPDQIWQADNRLTMEQIFEKMEELGL